MNTALAGQYTEIIDKENAEEKASSLEVFLQEWDAEYKEAVSQIDLFNPAKTSQWTMNQKQLFVKLFYHSRGHFKDFLWYLGNFSPSKEIKDIILRNIEEEFNGDDLSHEQHYLNYANSMGVNLKNEFYEHNFYFQKMRDFNLRQIKWLGEHDWDYCFSAFSAYERLDSTDYKLLMDALETDHEFFVIHSDAEHFEKTFSILKSIWNNKRQAVEGAFSFIAITQIDMWQNLSDAVFTYKG